MADASKVPPAAPMAKTPEWAPRIWQGCNFYAWMRLLIKNRFAIHWSRSYIAVIITLSSIMHSVLALVHVLIYGRALKQTQLKGPPIFILGHWRTGTTWLHEMLIQDPRLGYATTYECLDPHHFLLTERLFSFLLARLVPKERPMDHVKAGLDRPQEDEFALCMMGLPSPYATIAFPNNPPQDQEYLDFERVPPAALARWKKALLGFLIRVTYKSGKRLVLKSPPHTSRIAVLKEMFPDALFLHIVRDPYVVFPSTVNLWRTLYTVQGMQIPRFEGLEEHVFTTFTRMYAKLEQGKRLLPPQQFYELRYEDLVHDPAATLRCIYDHFGLGGWNDMQPRLEKYLAGLRGYETNKYRLTAAQRNEIGRRWGEVIRRYGYDKIEEMPAEESVDEPVAARVGS
jgi:hypothetical protein